MLFLIPKSSFSVIINTHKHPISQHASTHPTKGQLSCPWMLDVNCIIHKKVLAKAKSRLIYANDLRFRLQKIHSRFAKCRKRTFFLFSPTWYLSVWCRSMLKNGKILRYLNDDKARSNPKMNSIRFWQFFTWIEKLNQI